MLFEEKIYKKMCICDKMKIKDAVFCKLRLYLYIKLNTWSLTESI